MTDLSQKIAANIKNGHRLEKIYCPFRMVISGPSLRDAVYLLSKLTCYYVYIFFSSLVAGSAARRRKIMYTYY